MKNSIFAIQLKKGLNDLPFGSTAEECNQYFGEPNEIEVLEKDSDDEPDTELWYYDDENFSLFFEGDPNLVLTSIEINNQEATLFGKKVFEMTEDQIIELMKGQGYFEMYTEVEEWGEKLLSFEVALIDFYFENEKLITVNWSVDFPE